MTIEKLADAIATHSASHALGHEQGRAEERAWVVAWLRAHSAEYLKAGNAETNGLMSDSYFERAESIEEVADAIERGEHDPQSTK